MVEGERNRWSEERESSSQKSEVKVRIRRLELAYQSELERAQDPLGRKSASDRMEDEAEPMDQSLKTTNLPGDKLWNKPILKTDTIQ